jgi:lipopolysaccharide/colanic/teichoic acid biosynthesis glycosyltransferase
MHTSETSFGSGRLRTTHATSKDRPEGSLLSPWCSSAGKRALDMVVASLALIALWPILLLIAVTVRFSSPGPALFRQERVGRRGRLFQLLKFRSMKEAAERFGPRITCQNDSRIFPVGRILRKWKLDELPQLINVLRGEMSLVGPRPELPEFCATLGRDQRVILELRPGVTSVATLRYRDEERILATQQSRQLTDYYVNQLYPEKVWLDIEYAKTADFVSDFRILLQTAAAIFVIR